MSGSIRKQQEKIKKQMRDDIKGTQSIANQLTGHEEIGTKKLRDSKKADTKTTQATPTVDKRKLEKFLDFMEGNYENEKSLLRVKLKRKV